MSKVPPFPVPEPKKPKISIADISRHNSRKGNREILEKQRKQTKQAKRWRAWKKQQDEWHEFWSGAASVVETQRPENTRTLGSAVMLHEKTALRMVRALHAGAIAVGLVVREGLWDDDCFYGEDEDPLLYEMRQLVEQLGAKTRNANTSAAHWDWYYE